MIKTIKSLVRIGVWTGLTIAFGAAITKIISVSMGPAGVGYFSIFRQLQQTFVSVATFSGETALIQGISGREKNKGISYANTVGKLIAASLVFFCSLCALSFYIFQDAWQSRLNIENTSTLYLLLASCTFASLMSYYNSVLNGNGKVGLSVKLQASAACGGFLYAAFFSNTMSDTIIAGILSVIAFIGFGSASYKARKHGYVNCSRPTWLTKDEKIDARYFLEMSSVALLVGFSGAGTLLLVRLALVDRYGIEGAGLFDAAWTMSTIYLALFLSSFGGYFLPKLSACKDALSFNAEVNSLMYLSLIVSIALIVPFIYLKPVVFNIFYSSDFSGSIKIFRWMLLGDYFKVSAWVLSIPMLARAYMKPYLIFSLGWNATFIVGFFICWSWNFNLEALGISYLIAQVFYSVGSYFFWTKIRGLSFSRKILWLWLAGFLLLVFCSLMSWGDSEVSIADGLVIGMLLFVYFWHGLGQIGRRLLVEKLFRKT
jgi:O-antigen/teichoic acid export membrane protein